MAVLAGLLNMESRIGQFQFTQPLVSASLVGLILGDLPMGVTIGITLQLMWMGIVGIGASTPPDIVLGSVIATSMAILTGQGLEVALALAVPVSLVGQSVNIFVYTMTSGLVHWAERRVEKGDLDGPAKANLMGMIFLFLKGFLLVFPAIYYGVDFVNGVAAKIPPVLSTGLSAAGGMLPALGFGMTLSMVGMPALFPYFFIGFVVSTFLKVPLVGIAAAGVAIAFLHDYFLHKDEPLQLLGGAEGAAEHTGVLTKSDLRKAAVRSLFIQSGYNYERMQNLGYSYIVNPLLKKIYKNRPDLYEAAVRRNLEFFNTQPYLASPIAGVALAMEEGVANDQMTPESISAFKVATMGPLAGVGDSLFWMTFRPIAMGIGISLATGGNVLGPIVALILFNIPHLWTRYYPLVKGYQMGISFLAGIQGGLQRFTEALGVLSMLVLGTMTATMVKVTTKLVIPIGQATVDIQKVLDAIFPNLLPVVLVWVCYGLLKKGHKPTRILIGILVLGIVGALVKFFQ